MEFKELTKRAREVKKSYIKLNKIQGNKPWSMAEYTQGLVGDVGDLTKLVMAKSGYRKYDDVDKKLAHELADCLWSIIIIADELGINLEKEFLKIMDGLKKKVSSKIK